MNRIDEGLAITIQRGPKIGRYRSPVSYDGFGVAITWLNDYMRELESGGYD